MDSDLEKRGSRESVTPDQREIPDCSSTALCSLSVYKDLVGGTMELSGRAGKIGSINLLQNIQNAQYAQLLYMAESG